MAVKVYKPTTPGRRKSSVQDFSDITAKRSLRSLIVPMHKNSGRNNTGKITVRHRGGGAKRMYRIVDFKRANYDVVGEIKAVEYDPNRGARIAHVLYTSGDNAYILLAKGMSVGDKIVSTLGVAEPVTGNRMPLKNIPLGLFVYNIELNPGQGGKIVRGAGNGAQIQTTDAGYVQIKLPSGEMRLVNENCLATVGVVSNSDYKLVRWGKAGRMRHRGKKPTVRGKVMNPVDHPHGGGEGKNPIGLKGGPKTIWGKKAYGVKTRKPGKWSNKFIISRRKSKNK
jgi:large subunit ribosomal protein L2